MSSGLRLLRCPVQTYHWGKLGKNSLVGKIGALGKHLDSVDDQTHYAELWMGTHPSKPSVLQDDNRLLQEISDDLSFLFKILSVETALSIQAHPNKTHAAELRAKDPKNYPDSNHKPEIAIALTDFEALCCFRPLDEISNFIKNVPELQAVVGSAPINTKEDLKKAFTNLMTCSPHVFEPQLDSFIDRLGKESDANIPDDLRDIILRVSKQYPGDIGLFNMFFLNYLKLRPGDALFLAANEPHAYLNGDCVECMATSDNVVRAGLTPKFKDVGTLVNMLSYVSTKDVCFKPEVVRQGVQRFRPPVDDFAVLRYDVESEQTLELLDSHSIAVVIEGEGKLVANGANTLTITEGQVIYVPKSTEVQAIGNFLLFQAYTPC